MPTESMPSAATSLMTSRLVGGSNWTSTGRPVASLTARPHRATYRAPRSTPFELPVVRVASTAPSSSFAAAATSASCPGVFFTMVRPAANETPMPQTDLPVGNAVGGAQVVVARALLGRGAGKTLLSTENGVSLVLGPQYVRG